MISPWSLRPSVRLRPRPRTTSAATTPRGRRVAPSTSIAASLSASERSETSTAEARACSSRVLTLASVSLAIAASSDGDRRRIGIAEHVFGRGKPHAGSGAPSVSVPSTSRMTPRSPLLTLILVESRLGRLADRFGGDRVEQADVAPASCDDEDLGVGFADREIAFRERCQRRLHRSDRRSRRARAPPPRSPETPWRSRIWRRSCAAPPRRRGPARPTGERRRPT